MKLNFYILKNLRSSLFWVLFYMLIFLLFHQAAGLATMISTMRPDIDNMDEYVRNTTARYVYMCVP